MWPEPRSCTPILLHRQFVEFPGRMPAGDRTQHRPVANLAAGFAANLWLEGHLSNRKPARPSPRYSLRPSPCSDGGGKPHEQGDGGRPVPSRGEAARDYQSWRYNAALTERRTLPRLAPRLVIMLTAEVATSEAIIAYSNAVTPRRSAASNRGRALRSFTAAIPSMLLRWFPPAVQILSRGRSSMRNGARQRLQNVFRSELYCVFYHDWFRPSEFPFGPHHVARARNTV